MFNNHLTHCGSKMEFLSTSFSRSGGRSSASSTPVGMEPKPPLHRVGRSAQFTDKYKLEDNEFVAFYTSSTHVPVATDPSLALALTTPGLHSS